MLGQPLEDARLHQTFRVDLKRRTDCTTASLGVINKCLDGIEVDHEYLLELGMNLTDVDNRQGPWPQELCGVEDLSSFPKC